MSASATAILGYAAWSMALVGAIAALQTALTLGGGRATHHFEPDGSDISPFAARLSRAYANCNENLPAFAAILLTALATEQSEITDGLALWVFAARIAQSTIHLVSTNAPAVYRPLRLLPRSVGHPGLVGGTVDQRVDCLKKLRWSLATRRNSPRSGRCSCAPGR